MLDTVEPEDAKIEETELESETERRKIQNYVNEVNTTINNFFTRFLMYYDKIIKTLFRKK